MKNTEAAITSTITPFPFQCKDCTSGFDFADEAEEHSYIYNHDVANRDVDTCPDCGTPWTDHFDLTPTIVSFNGWTLETSVVRYVSQDHNGRHILFGEISGNVTLKAKGHNLKLNDDGSLTYMKLAS